MIDPRLRRLAGVLTNYSLELGEGDLVLIEGPAIAEPLIVELVRACSPPARSRTCARRSRGADEAYLAAASDSQLDHLPAYTLEEMDAIDARIAVHAAWNTRELSGIDPGKLARRPAATQPLMSRFMERSAGGDLRWCVTAYPCDAFAQDADMSLDAYADFIYRAGWLHLDRPRCGVARLRDHAGGSRPAARAGAHAAGAGRGHRPDRRRRRPFLDRLARRAQLPRRRGVHRAGRVGDLGDVRFSFPAVMGGREVQDVRLRFEDGRVVASEAAAGHKYLVQMLSMDDGASVLGEFAIGTNYMVTEFTKQILFDEKIGGTCHMALGAGYPDSGSVNRSGLHWDMVCDLRSGGEIHADGEPIYRDGAFLPSFFAGDLHAPAA